MKTIKVLSLLIPFLGMAGVAQAHDEGTWVLRGGVAMVDPKSGNLSLGAVPVDGGLTLVTSSVEVDSGTSLSIGATYMFSPNWGFDILGALPFSHDIDIATTISDGVNPDVSATLPLGETKHLPPTFSIQYHFAPDAAFQPYAGLGLNYTTFFDEETSSDVGAVGVSNLKLDDSFGVALQLGADWELNEDWVVNLDIRYINIETDATLTIDDGSGPVTGEVGTVEIDPIVFNLTFGYRF